MDNSPNYREPEVDMQAFDADLHPQRPTEKADGLRTAFDVKTLHRRLQQFEDDELKAIPILAQGTRLEQGSTYIDLRADDCQEFRARGDMEATQSNWYVPKNEVDYVLWNRLIGVDNPERLDQADD